MRCSERLRVSRIHLGCPYPIWQHPDMPTVLRSGPYRFFFYAGDRHEPAHVHIERDASKAKFWLEPISLQSSTGFSRAELNTIYRLIE